MYEALDMLSFQRRFPNERACERYLLRQRWPEGFRCPRCAHDRAWQHTTRRLSQCQRCRYQASLTAGTIFHKTRVPLRSWFWLIFLLSHTKHGVSMLAAQKLLRLGSYKTIWTMAHKIRTAMASRDARYQLAGLTELDESYFGGKRGGKRGRGAAGKRPVMVAVSTTAQGRPAFAKMQVVSTVDTAQARQTVQAAIQAGQPIKTDGLSIYPALAEDGYVHQPVVQGTPASAHVVLPWVHTLASNAKRFLQGTHHREAPKHLQRFLDEFCYRFNRRWHDPELFTRLLTACTTTRTKTYSELTA